MKIFSENGQVLLLTVFIGLILFLAVPLIVYMNQMGAKHQTHTQKSSRGLGVAEEGMAFAMRRLSATEVVWSRALRGNFADVAECNSGTNIQAPSGGLFQLECSTGTAGNPQMQVYQVSVVATAMLPGRSPTGLVPVRSLEGYISKKTVGATLPSGFSAPAALQLVLPPITPEDSLFVHWGPIVLNSSETWTLANPLNQANNGGEPFLGYPRKFSNGAITGPGGGTCTRSDNWANNSVVSDFREYWAYSNLQFPPVMDIAAYQTAATLSGCAGVLPSDGDAPVQTGCSYVFTFSTTTAIVSGTFAFPAVTRTVFISGNAEWNNGFGVDLGTGTVVVTGNLTLLSNPGTGINVANLRVSTSAAREYSYWPTTGPGWPCRGNIGSTCASAAAYGGGNFVHFRGTLIVLGDLIVQGDWRLAGNIIVGNLETGTGMLDLSTAGASLTLMYDDLGNRNIRTPGIQLQVDHLIDHGAD